MKKSIMLIALVFLLSNLCSGQWTDNINYGFTSIQLNTNSYSANLAISPIIYGDDIFFVNTNMKICKIHKNDFGEYSSSQILVPSQKLVRPNSNLIHNNNHIYFIGTDNRIYNISYNGTSWTNGVYPVGGWAAKKIRTDSKILLDTNMGIFYIGMNDNKIYRVYYQNGWNGGITPIVSNQISTRAGSNLIYYNNHVYFIGSNNRLYDIFYNGTNWSNGTFPTGGWSTETIRIGSEIILDPQLGIFYIGNSDGKIYRIYYQNGWNGGQNPLISNQKIVRSNSKLFFYNNHVYFIATDSKIYDILYKKGTFVNGRYVLNTSATPVKLQTELIVNSEGLFYINTTNEACFLIYDNIDIDRTKAWSYGKLNTGNVSNNFTKIVNNNDNQDMYFIDNTNKLSVFTRLIKNPIIHEEYGTPIFSEEFNGNYSHNGWSKIFDWGFRDNGSNKAYTTQNDENISFNANNIIISTKYEPDNYLVWGGTWSCWDQSGCAYEQYDYTTAMLNSGKGSINNPSNFFFKYGYIEIRCKIPASNKTGQGFWLTGYNSPPYTEIDICEFLASQELTGNVHWQEGNSHSSHPFRERPIGYRFYDNYYTYGLLWENDKLTWYLNNEKVAEYIEPPNSTSVPDYFMRIYLTERVWDYTNFRIEDLPENIPNDFIIDYIRVYDISKGKLFGQKKDKISIKNSQNTISTYPNPAKTYFNIETPPNSTIKIYNLLGELVYSDIVTGKSTIKTTSFTNGLYLVTIQSPFEIYKQQILITK